MYLHRACAYRADYECMTMPLLYEPMPYSQAVEGLRKVAALLRNEGW